MSSSTTFIILYLGIAFLFILFFDLLVRYQNRRSFISKKSIIVEVIPPVGTTKTPYSTEKLINVIHSFRMRRTLKSILLGADSYISLELVSSRHNGIRYMVRLPEEEFPILAQQITAYLPAVKIIISEDYLDSVSKFNDLYISEYRQVRNFAYPLIPHSGLTEHDPIAYMAGSMTNLNKDEQICLQLIIKPARLREISRIRNKLLIGEDPNLKTKVRPLLWLMTLPLILLSLVLDEISGLGQSRQRADPKFLSLSTQQQAVIDSISDKVGQDLFEASLRVMYRTDNETRAVQMTRAMDAAITAFNVPGFQQLILKRSIFSRLLVKSRTFIFLNRLPALYKSNQLVLSVSEVASIYHFPNSDVTQTENLIVSNSRILPIPAIMKSRHDNHQFDVLLGENVYNGRSTDIGLTAEERERHMLILGGTGNGKTTMMHYAITQDISNGKGVAVVDPHGDLAKSLLKQVPEERLKDVIYLNPVDIAYPIGINLLELPDGLSENELVLEKDRVTEAAISVLRKVFSDDEANAHRIESLFRNAIHTAFYIEGATLFTVLKLLRNRAYRMSVVYKLEDEDLKDFWREEFGKAGEMQRVSMSKGLTARIDRFNSSEPAKRMLGQSKSTINFENIINTGKILICNLAEGELVEDTSALLGTTILAKLKLAAERRASIDETKRQPFYLYVDEFQNFATTPFVKMLSSSRKYKLYLTIAQQSTSQQEEQRLTESILSNVRTLVCFGTGSPADERLLLSQFCPYINEGEIANLPTHSFYIRIRAVEPMEPMSGQTVITVDHGSQANATRVQLISRTNYAKKYVSRKADSIEPERSKGYIEVKPTSQYS
jgi:hypothetical protein